MRISNRTLGGVGIGLLVAGGLSLALRAPASRSPEDEGGPAVAIGSEVPAFRAETIDPPVRTRTPADYRGEVLLLNIWATWCVPCVQEMPTLEKLYEAYGDSGLAIVAVSIDDSGSADRIREFRKQHGLTFEILHDPAAAIMDLLPRFIVPQTLVIDRRGRVRATRYGDDWFSAANRRLVERLLAE
jgi:cytochrome c biogenesis protein CcmG/thiol:disulfide interchange protein DsbE